MGQKVHPYGFRLGVTKNWRSRWFAKQDYAKLLHEDIELKASLGERLKAAGVSSIEVDRPGNKLRITIRTSRPGIIIGRKGAEIEKLKSDLAKKTKREVFIDIQEVHRPELDAQLVSESIALQLEKRVAFRRAMRKAVDSALRFGCKGIKVRVSGRLNGAEIARSEWYLQGQLPLHTLRADIDYGFSEARARRPRREGDRPAGDRPSGDRGGDRGGERRPPVSAPPVTAPPTVDVSGPIVQLPPTEMQKPAISPIIPPLSAPVAPSWKSTPIAAGLSPETEPAAAPEASSTEAVKAPESTEPPETPAVETPESKESHE